MTKPGRSPAPLLEPHRARGTTQGQEEGLEAAAETPQARRRAQVGPLVLDLVEKVRQLRGWEGKPQDVIAGALSRGFELAPISPEKPSEAPLVRSNTAERPSTGNSSSVAGLGTAWITQLRVVVPIGGGWRDITVADPLYKHVVFPVKPIPLEASKVGVVLEIPDTNLGVAEGSKGRPTRVPGLLSIVISERTIGSDNPASAGTGASGRASATQLFVSI